jgi:nucleoside-diphosphate-sugar epimerase
MRDSILILGAAGRLGYAAAETFRSEGWAVTGLVRPGAARRAPHGIKIVETTDRKVAVEAAKGMDVVLHALNPPQTKWRQMALPHAYAAIEAAETTGATLMFPGNIYNYGRAMPEVLDESTPMQPTTRKGHIRCEIEQRILEASERGMRTIILRAGDFFGGGRGAWFDLVLTKDLARHVVTYPGPIDCLHSWAYVPDLAATFVRLANVRDKLGAFETFGFPGHAVRGREMVAAIAKAAGQGVKVKRMAWWLIHALSPIVPLPREISELAYLWKVPHRIAGTKLASAIGTIPHTPLDVAVERALRALYPPRA